MPDQPGYEPIEPPERTKHSRETADLDHDCGSASIHPGEEPATVAAWLNAIAGWHGLVEKVDGESVAVTATAVAASGSPTRLGRDPFRREFRGSEFPSMFRTGELALRQLDSESNVDR